MTFLNKKFSILIYENDKLLNSILHYQIVNYENCNVFVYEDLKSLLQTASEKKNWYLYTKFGLFKRWFK